MDGTRGRDVGLPSLVFQADSEPHSLGGDLTRPEALLTDCDRRERVGDATRQPFINILHLVASFSGTGTVSRGSAFLTNAYGCLPFGDETFVIALTAAHVVCPERSTRVGNRTFDRRPEDIAQSLRVAIAADGPVSRQEFTLWRGQPDSPQNYGWYEVAPSWLNDGTPGTADTRWSEDYAALFLKKTMLPPECMGFHVLEEQLDPQMVANMEHITCAGYPAGDKWARTMLWATGRLRIVTDGTRMVTSATGSLSLVSHPSMDSQVSARHDVDTDRGQSGSPLYVGDGHDYPFTALAMHHQGTPPPAYACGAYNEALLVDSALIAKVKAFPQPQGYVGFPIPQIEATPTPRLTVLTEENIATCNEKLNTLHIKAVASRLCHESRLMQFSLGARVSSTDLEFHCPRDRNTSLPEHALRVVTYLANERDVTVARALRLAKFAGCPLSVREALLEVRDPMEVDN